MQRVNLDTAGKTIKEFIHSLPIGEDDVELELNGKVVCKISSPNKLSDAEKAALRKKGWALLRRAHERNKDVPAHVISHEVDAAVREVRGRC